MDSGLLGKTVRRSVRQGARVPRRADGFYHEKFLVQVNAYWRMHAISNERVKMTSDHCRTLPFCELVTRASQSTHSEYFVSPVGSSALVATQAAVIRDACITSSSTRSTTCVLWPTIRGRFVSVFSQSVAILKCAAYVILPTEIFHPVAVISCCVVLLHRQPNGTYSLMTWDK